jgi:hypothetical protein
LEWLRRHSDHRNLDGLDCDANLSPCGYGSRPIIAVHRPAGLPHDVAAGKCFGGAAGVTVLGLFSDGSQEHVLHGALLAPADGFSVGYVVWYLSAWRVRLTKGIDIRIPVAVLSSLLAGAAGGFLGLLAFAARTDIPHPAAKALADGLVIAVLTWFVLDPTRATAAEARGNDGPSIGWFEAVRLAAPAAAVGLVTGGLDAYSVGAPGIAYGVAAGVIVGYRTFRLSSWWSRRTPDDQLIGYRGPSHWAVRPEEAGLVVTVVVGVVADFSYALLYGLTAALAVKIALEIYGRRRPSTGLRRRGPASRAGPPSAASSPSTSSATSACSNGWRRSTRRNTEEAAVA